jgi:hypothetical protein
MWRYYCIFLKMASFLFCPELQNTLVSPVLNTIVLAQYHATLKVAHHD